MTFLGLGVLAFYAALLASGEASLEILPQYAISIIFFLFSGKLMRQAAARLPEKERDETQEEKPETDWALRTTVLNWVATCMVITVMVLLLVKPAGMTFADLLQFTSGTDRFPALAMP
jgi:Ca2+/Na+ antiporter